MSLNLRESGNGLRDDRHFGAAPLTPPLLAINALRHAYGSNEVIKGLSLTLIKGTIG